MKINVSKYKQVVNYVTDGIHAGELKKGDRLPSINEFRKLYNLSRDTVFAGISELKSRGIIHSNPGVGNFITTTRIPSSKNIFLLFNEFNEFKEDLYNSFVNAVGKDIAVDLYFHNYNKKVFETLINDANGKYTTYVLMLGKFSGFEKLLEQISGRVFLLDHYPQELKGKYTSVAQNFDQDTYEALKFGLPKILKYDRIYMIQSEAKEPFERYIGLTKFAEEYGFEHRYFETIKNRSIKEGDLFIVVQDRDLVDLLKQAAKQQFTPGKEFGIISYNETPFKEILAGGITTLSTNFQLMGKTMASLINKKNIETINTPWNLNLRSSL